MIGQAQRCYVEKGLKNITYVRGDVGQLPFKDESIDWVLSMNGFHAFPDKELAWNEITRVLKKGGVLVGCFYIQGKRPFADFFIRHIYTRYGTFTAPFWSEADILERLNKQYIVRHHGNRQSIFYFKAEKR